MGPHRVHGRRRHALAHDLSVTAAAARDIASAAEEALGEVAARPGRGATRSWLIESRSRTVTAWSSRVSKSTVTQYGVPISSWRR